MEKRKGKSLIELLVVEEILRQFEDWVKGNIITVGSPPVGEMIDRYLKATYDKAMPSDVCHNPHEQVYRGCTSKCSLFQNCSVKGG